MHVAFWAGSECLWSGDVPDAVMGVRPGDGLDVPGSDEGVRMTVVRRHVSVAARGARESQLMLRLEVELG